MDLEKIMLKLYFQDLKDPGSEFAIPKIFTVKKKLKV